MTRIIKTPFFMTDLGQAYQYKMKNKNGMEVIVSSFGGVVVSIHVPDREGKMEDVVLGYDDYAGSCSRKYFLGAAIGRCANRIARGVFELNDSTYSLACNNGRNHLHGGDAGFDVKLWECTIVQSEHGESLELKYTSPDGEECYPATLNVVMTYSLSKDNAFILHYSAVSDADTLCNLTNHSYFNLAGHDSGTALGHELKIDADYFTETDDESIPTGHVKAVEHTPMDFRDFHRVGERIEMPYTQLKYGNGYDHNFVLNHPAGEIGFCAALYEPRSGRYMECYTDCPGVQLYTGNFLDGTQAGKNGCQYEKRSALCLETQFAPDAVHHAEWESPILRAGQRYEKTTIYRFGLDKQL